MIDEGKRNNKLVSMKEQFGSDELDLISEEEIDLLEGKVRGMLKEDIRSLSEVKRYIKSEETMRNSLGFLYSYLVSQKKCENCQGKLRFCPQPIKGYHESIRYDEDRDVITASRTPCSYEVERQSILNRITPCDRTRKSIYEDMISLVDALMVKESFAKMKDSGACLLSITKAIKALKNGKKVTGASFFGINGASLPNALLAFAAYSASKAGLRVAYLHTGTFFNALRDFNYDEKALAEKDYVLAKKADVLILENFTSYPYLPIEMQNKYLFPLLKEREKNGKLTYLSLSSSYFPKFIVLKALNGLDCKQEGADIIEKIAPLATIKDFDIR